MNRKNITAIICTAVTFVLLIVTALFVINADTRFKIRKGPLMATEISFDYLRHDHNHASPFSDQFDDYFTANKINTAIITVNNSDNEVNFNLACSNSSEYVGVLTGEKASAINGRIQVKVSANYGEIWIPAENITDTFKPIETIEIEKTPKPVKVVEKVEDVVSIGDEIVVKVMEIDDQGRINLSRKDALADIEAKKANS